MTIEKAISTNWFNQRGHFQITRRLNTTTQFWKCAANQSADLTHPYYWLSFSNFTNLVSDRLTLLSHRPTGAAIPKAVAAIAVWENQITSVVTCPLCLTSCSKKTWEQAIYKSLLVIVPNKQRSLKFSLRCLCASIDCKASAINQSRFKQHQD